MLALTLRFKPKGQAVAPKLAPKCQPSDQIDQDAHDCVKAIPAKDGVVDGKSGYDEQKEPDGDGVGHGALCSLRRGKLRASEDGQAANMIGDGAAIDYGLTHQPVKLRCD